MLRDWSWSRNSVVVLAVVCAASLGPLGGQRLAVPTEGELSRVQGMYNNKACNDFASQDDCQYTPPPNQIRNCDDNEGEDCFKITAGPMKHDICIVGNPDKNCNEAEDHCVEYQLGTCYDPGVFSYEYCNVNSAEPKQTSGSRNNCMTNGSDPVP